MRPIALLLALCAAGVHAQSTAASQPFYDRPVQSYLASARDPLYNVGGAVAVKPRAGNTARHVGGEIDLSAAWNVSSQWKLGAGIGHLKAGRFLKENSTGSGQTFPYLFAQYSY